MPDAPHQAKRKGPVGGPEPAHLDVIFFDARTGQKQSRTAWPTSARYFSRPLFFGIPDGKLLTCSENALRLLSPSSEMVKETHLPNDASCVNVAFQHSPSRRTLLVSILSEHGRQIELLDVETLAILSSWNQEKVAGATFTGIASISDHCQVGYCGEPTGLCVRRFDEPWEPFRPAGFDTQMTKRGRTPVSFVSDQTLTIEGKATTIATVDGMILFQITPPDKRVLLPPVPSSGGARFAVIEDRFRGLRSEPLDMYPFTANDRVSVYSMKDRRAIFSIKLKGTSPWTPWDVHDNVLALSPDGSFLAVVSDGVLKLYRLPSESSEQH
jgi:hypothetical protein